jgi:hypothetical protein
MQAGNSIIERCVGVVISPKKTFLSAAEDHNEWHVILLSLCFGLLFARHIIRSENRDLIFYFTTALASGVGFVYFAGFFLSWLIKITGPFVHPEKMRMVMSYALTPYILSLSLLFLTKSMPFPGASTASFFLTVYSWWLAVLGVKTVAEIKLVQSLFVVILPVAALILVIAILFKVAWMISGV